MVANFKSVDENIFDYVHSCNSCWALLFWVALCLLVFCNIRVYCSGTIKFIRKRVSLICKFGAKVHYFRNCSSCVLTARIFLLFNLSFAVQICV